MFVSPVRKIARAALRFAKPDWRSPIKAIALPELKAIDSNNVSKFPTLVRNALERTITGMRQELPPAWTKLTQPDLAYVFASSVAHHLKPYGEGCPSQKFDDLLEAPFLDCSNYGLLAFYISLLLVDEKDRRPICFVGWDGGSVGNHQMLFVRNKEETMQLALDPTFGIACIASFDQVASGTPISPDSIALIGANDQLKASRDAFVQALLEGQFRPSDLLYYFHSAEDFTSGYGDPFGWPTPAVTVLRNRYGRCSST